MRAALLVTADHALRDRVLRERGDSTVFTAPRAKDALDLIRVTEMDLVILDVLPGAHGLTEVLHRARQISSAAAVVCLYPPDGLTPEDWEVVKKGDFLLRKPFASEDLASVLKQAEEKHELLLEASTLRARTAETAPVVSKPAQAVPPPPVHTASVLKALDKPLSAGFDAARVHEIFLDVVGEMVQPSRTALLLASGRAAAFTSRPTGGWPHLVKSIRLTADAGLAQWFAREGRPALPPRLTPGQRSRWPEIAQVRILQAVVGVPCSPTEKSWRSGRRSANQRRAVLFGRGRRPLQSRRSDSGHDPASPASPPAPVPEALHRADPVPCRPAWSPSISTRR
jgi:CheY-like chemotaxis protein